MKPLPLLVLGQAQWDSWPWAWPRRPRSSKPGAPDKEVIEMEAFPKILEKMGITRPIGGNTVPVIRGSKHAGGHRRPHDWHQKLRARRRAKRAARRAQRGR